VNDELQRISKEVAVSQLTYYPGTFLQRLRKNHEKPFSVYVVVLAKILTKHILYLSTTLWLYQPAQLISDGQVNIQNILVFGGL
jgi:hypothetical protein